MLALLPDISIRTGSVSSGESWSAKSSSGNISYDWVALTRRLFFPMAQCKAAPYPVFVSACFFLFYQGVPPGNENNYSFTAPLVSPLMIYFCMKIKINVTGIMVTTAKAVR